MTAALDMSRPMTAEEVRKLFRLGKDTFRELIRQHPHYCVPPGAPRQKLFFPEDVDRLKEAMPLKLIDPRKAKSPNYYLRGTVRGISIYETTWTSDPDAAEQIRITREKELLEESIHGPRVTTTFMQAAITYVEHGGSDRFLGKQDQVTGRWDGLIGRFGPDRLSALAQDDLDKAALALYPNASPDTRNRQVYTPFIAVWNDAAARGKCEHRDWRRPRKAKGTRVRVRQRRNGSFPVPYEHAASFVPAMPPLDAINMTILFYTGLRPIEWFNVEDIDVNLSGRWISLPSTKTGEPRGVPVHDFIVPLLQALLDRFGGLLANHYNRRGRNIEPYPVMKDAGGQMSGAVDFARRRTGITDISPYTARHSVSTYLVAAGVHQFVKDQILGHAATEMSRRYTDIPQPELIEAINKLPVPDLWKSADFVENPWKRIDEVVKWSQYQGDRRKFRRPW